jgi:cytochrome P450
MTMFKLIAIFSNGPEWSRLRTILQRAISIPRNVRAYIPASDVTIQHFLQLVRARVNKEPDDFLPELSRVFGEREFLQLLTFFVPRL